MLLAKLPVSATVILVAIWMPPASLVYPVHNPREVARIGDPISVDVEVLGSSPAIQARIGGTGREPGGKEDRQPRRISHP